MRSIWKIQIPQIGQTVKPHRLGLRRLQTQVSFNMLDSQEQFRQKPNKRQKRNTQNHEAVYTPRQFGYEVYRVPHPVQLDFGKQLKNVEIAYETWGQLNADKSNAILLHTGLSASSHAHSHAKNEKPGWWEKFIGPGKTLDTNKFFVICTNVLGGCHGSTGPSSFVPQTKTSSSPETELGKLSEDRLTQFKKANERYATNFPIVTLHDMIRVQADLLKSHLGIEKLHASMGSSMGAMQCLAFANEFPDRVGRVLSISGCARSHPSSIASRFVQRQVLMHDPNWNRGFYYDGPQPHTGMKLAREIGTITYRSGPEWEQRFSTQRVDTNSVPSLGPDYLIETYLDYQGEKFLTQYDPNSMLYISKAMDIFDLGKNNRAARQELGNKVRNNDPAVSSSALGSHGLGSDKAAAKSVKVQKNGLDDLVEGMKPMAHIPTLVLGVESDTLFPVWQQREIYNVLTKADPSNKKHEYHELGNDKSLYGHDTFLVDLNNVGPPIKQFLEREF
ncbi:hypothetical protein DASB73_034790 [Starmerella bacillaris]|uniref:AB hydrolase-1 domain-containing protein n=1 Tax=Starmerella bacillaris TaxID=1247836 RepID=A0AAV5RLW2_STABA|nr:hypothetical protein DASB73_034790 [Starmerella bacillaris]